MDMLRIQCSKEANLHPKIRSMVNYIKGVLNTLLNTHTNYAYATRQNTQNTHEVAVVVGLPSKLCNFE